MHIPTRTKLHNEGPSQLSTCAFGSLQKLPKMCTVPGDSAQKRPSITEMLGCPPALSWSLVTAHQQMEPIEPGVLGPSAATRIAFTTIQLYVLPQKKKHAFRVHSWLPLLELQIPSEPQRWIYEQSYMDFPKRCCPRHCCKNETSFRIESSLSLFQTYHLAVGNHQRIPAQLQDKDTKTSTRSHCWP